MLINTLKILFTRDLEKVKNEIAAYQEEENIWRVTDGIKNSGGNLCLHLVGNLNAFIGAEIGKSGYIRQRDLEFSLKDVPRSELIQQVEETIVTVNNALDRLTSADLEKEYPLLVFTQKTSTGYFLVHLSTHLTYHLGQINYHRRLLD